VVEQTAATPARDALRPDLDLATASAITRALTGPEIFESLVLDSGWDPIATRTGSARRSSISFSRRPRQRPGPGEDAQENTLHILNMPTKGHRRFTAAV